MPYNAWTVIVVDDTFDDRQVLSTMLKYYGVSVYATENGEECRVLLSRLVPTLIITDLAMPGGDGWGVLETVRGNPATAQVPVVAVTSYHSTKLADEAINGGFDAYFPKPLNPDSFLQELEAIIGG